jgi:thiamine-phosphate pyrophosphorylase
LSAARLYLDFTNSEASPETASDVLIAALDAGPVASVLFRPHAGAALDAEAARGLASIAQRKGIAALVLSDPARASEVGADGIHLPWDRDVVAQFKEARRSAPATVIIGADAGRTRHDAMELGEAGADYVAFGIPSHVEDRARAAERQLELVAWWTELFEIPCIAFDVGEVEHAERLVEAGADFVTVAVTDRDSITGAVARVRAYADVLLAREGAH